MDYSDALEVWCIKHNAPFCTTTAIFTGVGNTILRRRVTAMAKGSPRFMLATEQPTKENLEIIETFQNENRVAKSS